jgi:mono/diheme cytochrome c family protein
MTFSTRKILGALALSAAGISSGLAADGAEMLNRDCAACHNLTGPASSTLQQLWERKGPDLFYAGSKYKAAWLEQWLQQPSRIRPAGMFYGNHLKSGAAPDEVDAGTLTQHPALPATDAKAAAVALMKLTARSELIKKNDYQPGNIALSMGEMLFDKFRGCLGCHEIEPGYGGVSGPEVYTAGQRLQEDWLMSFLRNPQAWEPKAFMPNKHLSDTDVQKLVHYLRALSEEKK